MARIPLILCAVLVSIVAIDAWPIKCSTKNFHPFNKFYRRWGTSRCYALITTKKTWWQARSACKSLDPDAFLVVISTNSEWNWISSHIHLAPGYNSAASYWVGGRKSGSRWRWDKFNISVNMNRPPWAPGEPNGSGTKMVIDKTGGKWKYFDRAWNSKYGYICEIPQNKLGWNPPYTATRD